MEDLGITHYYFDLDQFLVNNRKRWEMARFLTTECNFLGRFKSENERKNFLYSEKALYQDKWIAEDEVIPGAVRCFNSISCRLFRRRTFILSSRYWYTEEATMHWLIKNGFYIDNTPLLLKEEESQFFKTKNWKAKTINDTVLTANFLHALQVKKVVVLDDSQEVRESVLKYVPRTCKNVICFDSVESFQRRHFD